MQDAFSAVTRGRLQGSKDQGYLSRVSTPIPNNLDTQFSTISRYPECYVQMHHAKSMRLKPIQGKKYTPNILRRPSRMLFVPNEHSMPGSHSFLVKCWFLDGNDT